MQPNRFVSCLAGLTALLLLAMSGVASIGVNEVEHQLSLAGSDMNCDGSDEYAPHPCDVVSPNHQCSSTYQIASWEEGQIADFDLGPAFVCMASGCRNLQITARLGDNCIPIEDP